MIKLRHCSESQRHRNKKDIAGIAGLHASLLLCFAASLRSLQIDNPWEGPRDPVLHANLGSHIRALQSYEHQLRAAFSKGPFSTGESFSKKGTLHKPHLRAGIQTLAEYPSVKYKIVEPLEGQCPQHILLYCAEGAVGVATHWMQDMGNKEISVASDLLVFPEQLAHGTCVSHIQKIQETSVDICGQKV